MIAIGIISAVLLIGVIGLIVFAFNRASYYKGRWKEADSNLKAQLEQLKKERRHAKFVKAITNRQEDLLKKVSSGELTVDELNQLRSGMRPEDDSGSGKDVSTTST